MSITEQLPPACHTAKKINGISMWFVANMANVSQARNPRRRNEQHIKEIRFASAEYVNDFPVDKSI